MWVINPKKGICYQEELKQRRIKMGKEDKKEPFLTNLGRATMRGLRRCQKCGTLNGTRGYSCKNKSCDVVFKEAGGKKKASSEPCKINTGTSDQIYSVRVRDKGPDYRGFVQLPILHNSGNNLLLSNGFTHPEMMVEGARCYVESCQKLNRFAPQPMTTPCSHIKAASQCYKDAQPLTLKNSVLNTLPIPSSFKQEMFKLATDTPGPLVQRVSKALVVVKCKPDTIHPLGLLHFSFIQTRVKKEGDHNKFYCSCRAFKHCSPPKESSFRKCVHLYSCLVAFASDERLCTEFSYFIDLIKRKPPSVDRLCLGLVVEKEELEEAAGPLSESEMEEGTEVLEDTHPPEDVAERSYFILNDTSSGTPCQVEVEMVPDEGELMEIPISATDTICTEEELESKLEIQLQTEDGLHLRTSDGGSISVHQLPDNIISGLKRKQDDSIVQASSALLTLQKSVNKKVDVNKKSLSCKRDLGDDSSVSFSFTSWLASVTERINQSMHYGFSGKPDPLVFLIPRIFFDCFLERLNRLPGVKRKLPHETQVLVRKDTLPVGKFTKYTWKLTSVGQVTQMFANGEVPLEVIRYFSLQKDGSYKVSKLPQPPQSGHSIEPGATHTHPIRPREYKTIMRVGIPCPVLLREPTPFIVEWVPDLLPKSQMGELTIKFEFDHFSNGQLLLKQPSVFVSKGTPLKPVKTLGPPLAPRPPQNKVTASICSPLSLRTPLNEVSHTTNSDGILSIPLNSENLSAGDSITLLTF